ncbi:MAG: hypothetical protein K2H09_02060 [Treponemataceae bacterium]|nr:hypothetical protein [Treponemataceae bacterium]
MQERPTRPDDAKVQRILRWRESLSTLPDDHFFELVRIYAGEIRTPFNKQKLIEQLSAIFHKAQCLENIVSYLSEFDIKVLSALSFMGDIPQNELIDFFSGEYPLSEIYSELMNLNERLVVYSYKTADMKAAALSINPLLEDALAPFITVQTLLPPAPPVVQPAESQRALSPHLLASFLSYIESSPDLCKGDGDIRKKDRERLEELFPGQAGRLQHILKAFLNTGIVLQGARHTVVDEKRAAVFAELPEHKQYACLSVAAAARLGRMSLQKHAQLLLDIAATIPAEGFTRTSLLRAAALQEKKSEARYGSAPAQGRFSRMLAQSRAGRSDTADGTAKLIESIIDCAVEFGFFAIAGTADDGTQVFTAGAALRAAMEAAGGAHRKTAPEPQSEPRTRGLLNITAGTNITILPGLSLSELLPLIPFMDIISCDTALEFEITRKSACCAFDKDILPEQMYGRLSAFSAYEIPQNLRINIEEWYSSYSAALLYQGYVLKVDEKNERILEKNPRLSQYVQAKLAPGIYFLNLRSDTDARAFMSSGGLDFTGAIKTAGQNEAPLPFPPLEPGTSLLSEQEHPARTKASGTPTDEERREKAERVKREFHTILDSMEMAQQQRGSLSARIDRNIILSKEQLNPNTVRLEILEADGINYSAKVHLIENAISAGDLIELTVPADNDMEKSSTFLGKPLLLSKHSADTLVKMQLEPDEEVRFFSVSKANYVKRIKTSLF